MDPAAPFALPTLAGTVVTPKSLRGQRALFLFWNIGCAGCTGRALPLAAELAAQYPALRLLAIHSHFSPAPVPRTAIETVARHWELPPATVALDEGDATYRAFGAEGTPHWVLLDEAGTPHKSFFGSMEGSRQRLRYSLAEWFDGEIAERCAPSDPAGAGSNSDDA